MFVVFGAGLYLALALLLHFTVMPANYRAYTTGFSALYAMMLFFHIIPLICGESSRQYIRLHMLQIYGIELSSSTGVLGRYGVPMVSLTVTLYNHIGVQNDTVEGESKGLVKCCDIVMYFSARID